MAAKVKPQSSKEDEHLASLFATYDKLDTHTPSSWISFKKDWSFHVHHFKEVCHASMSYATAGSVDELITAVVREDARSLAYIRMLISGPFRSFSDLISLEFSNNHYFIRCSSLDKWPANVLYNFCIATRAPLEKPEMFERWDKLLAKGVDPTLAFLISASTTGVNPIVWHFTYQSHFWFDPSADWRAIINGEPMNFSQPYTVDPRQCQPTNLIWGKKEPAFSAEIRAHTGLDELSAYFGLELRPPLPVRTAPPPKKTYAEILNEQAQMFHNAGMPLGAMGQGVGAALHDMLNVPVQAQFHPNMIGNVPPPAPGNWHLVDPDPQVHVDFGAQPPEPIAEPDDIPGWDPFEEEQEVEADDDF